MSKETNLHFLFDEGLLFQHAWNVPHKTVLSVFV